MAKRKGPTDQDRQRLYAQGVADGRDGLPPRYPMPERITIGTVYARGYRAGMALRDKPNEEG